MNLKTDMSVISEILSFISITNWFFIKNDVQYDNFAKGSFTSLKFTHTICDIGKYTRLYDINRYNLLARFIRPLGILHKT